MDNISLEKFFETVILPNYEQIDIAGIKWEDHGKIDLDAWAHYFNDKSGNKYTLLFEDYPGNTFLNDGLTHEVIKHDNDNSMRFGSDVPFKYVENITGYFTLFREK